MNRLLLVMAGISFFFPAYSQNHPPVALADTIEVMSQTPVVFDALANDYDPDGDGISLQYWSNPVNGSLDTSAGNFRYFPETFSGHDYFEYRIIDNNPSPLKSTDARVLISILPNPGAPVARPDTLEMLELVPAEADLLSNDFDPDNDDIAFATMYGIGCEALLNEDSTRVTIVPEVGAAQAYVLYTVREINTSPPLHSKKVLSIITVLPNPDIPVIREDSAATTGGMPVVIYPLLNDFDPQGDPFEIYRLYVSNGNAMIQGDSIIYTPPMSMAGISKLRYSIREVEDTAIYTDMAYIYVTVSKNEACPVGEPDYASGITGMQITIDVLSNDHGTLLDPLEIYDIRSNGTAYEEGDSILYSSSPLTLGSDTLYYRIRHIHHEDYYSEWIPAYIHLDTNPALPVANDDFAFTGSGFSVDIRPLDNDLANGADTLILKSHYLLSNKGKAIALSDSLIHYSAYDNSRGRDTLNYLFGDKSDASLVAEGKIIIQIDHQKLYDSLNVNNINAGVHSDGFLFSNVGMLPQEGSSGAFQSHFKYPKGSETSTIISNTFWLGGKNDDDELHFAGERYRQIGVDFQPGPVSASYDSAFKARYWHLWKLTKADIEYHINNYWKEGYEPIEDIATWPGDGDPGQGQAQHLAPFKDLNADGTYDPLDGDYPLIRGDQCIFFISNDDLNHTESEGSRMRVEIHGMVYGFDEPGDSALWNTVFVHYDLINRSEDTYFETYAANFTDFDIGNPWDDYVGSDVTRSSYYAFNGDNFDDSWEDINSVYHYEGYGPYPPAQAVTVLSGPLMDADGLDNPSGGCDYSVNGTYFENGTQDDERFGLCRFADFQDENPYNFEHFTAEHFYRLMNGINIDGTPWQYGGMMGYLDPNAVGPECSFMYPGASDPLNWGTHCIPPNEGYNQDGKYWTNAVTRIPFEIRGLGIMGPFTFDPGQVQEIDLAYIAANGRHGPQSSVDTLMVYIDTLRARVIRGEIIIFNEYLGIQDKDKIQNKVRIFPNPAKDHINIDLPILSFNKAEYDLYDLMGKLLSSGEIHGNGSQIDISHLSPGLYVILVRTSENFFTAKFIKTNKP